MYSHHSSVLKIKIRNWPAVYLHGIFNRLLHCFPIENEWEIWLIIIDFGGPNAEISWKMANGQLLFLALQLKAVQEIRFRNWLVVFKDWIFIGHYTAVPLKLIKMDFGWPNAKIGQKNWPENGQWPTVISSTVKVHYYMLTMCASKSSTLATS